MSKKKTVKKKSRHKCTSQVPPGCPAPNWLTPAGRIEFVRIWTLTQQVPGGWPIDQSQLAIYCDYYAHFSNLAEEDLQERFTTKAQMAKQMSLIAERLQLSKLQQAAEGKKEDSGVSRRDRSRLNNRKLDS